MEVRRVVRVGGVVVVVTGTAVLALVPDSAQEQPDHKGGAGEEWFDDVEALAEAYARQGDTAAAVSAHDLAALYQDLVVTGRKA